jgi:ethanolamine kinase
MVQTLRHIDLHYDNADSRNTALRLVLTLFPEWESSQDTIEFVRFTDGITNTVR